MSEFIYIFANSKNFYRQKALITGFLLICLIYR